MNLRLQEVFRFLNSTPASRNFVEGEAVLNAGHIVLVGTTNVSDLQLDIFGVCLQTSSLKSNPHELKGRIQIDDGNSCKILAMECSCKAGLGETCKHISAVLLYCSRMDLSQLEQVSSTDVKCLWSQNKTTALKSYEPEPLASYACFESMEVTRVDEVNLMNMKNELMMSMPSCALAVHKFRKRKHTETVDCPGNDNEHPPITIGVMQAIGKVPNSAAMTNLSKVVVGPLRECCQNLYDQLKCDDYRSLCMDTLHSVEKWRKERQFRLTGSRCYEIFTYKKNDWMNKSSKYFWPSSFTNKYVQHGVKFEPVARRLYCRRYNVEVVECGLVISPQNPFLGFSPDGIVMKDGEPWKLLEVKCPFKALLPSGRQLRPLDYCLGIEMNASELVNACPYLKQEDGVVTLKKKHMYYGQVQLGMAILDLEECDFIVFSSFEDNFLNVSVKYDEGFVLNLLQKLKNNYFDNMLHHVCLRNVNQ